MRTVTLDANPEPLTVVVERTALIVVDMQNAYCSPGGYLDRIGFDMGGNAPIIAETRRVIDVCKAAGMTIIYLQNGFSPDGSDAPQTAPVWRKSNALRYMRDNPDWTGKLITPGGWDHAIVDELAPEPGDIVIPKSRYSGFAGTNLEQVLAARRIETVIVCGSATNVCVESTIRDAYHREYFPVMISDATIAAGEGAQAATEFNVTRFFGWLTTGQKLRKALSSNTGELT